MSAIVIRNARLINEGAAIDADLVGFQE